MVHYMMSQHEIARHLNRVLSHREMKVLIDRAHVERSEAFVELFSTMSSGVKKFFVK